MTLAHERTLTAESTPEPRPRLRLYLLASYALFIVYVSLSPFSAWQEQGLAFHDVLTAPLRHTYTWFDAVVNVLAYIPLGLLLGLILRTWLGGAGSVALAIAGGLALSGAMEYAQMYLPSRTSSNLDLLTNTSGTLAGALLAVSIMPRLWFAHHLTRLRRNLFEPDSDFGLALVALWAFVQINPSLPMLGNVFISEVARKPFLPPPPDLFSWQESLSVTLNLLMMGCLLRLLLRERRHAVLGLVLLLGSVSLLKFIAAAALLKSWALLLWLNSEAMLGIASGLLCLAAALALSPRSVRTLAGLSCGTYLLLTHFLLNDSAPSAALPLYQWHYQHLLNYNGLTQTVALLFPPLFLALLWQRRDNHTLAV
jgi:VanZ family protein